MYEIGSKVRVLDKNGRKIMTIKSYDAHSNTYKMVEDNRDISKFDIEDYAYEHDGCVGCYYDYITEEQEPCLNCKQNHITPNEKEDRWTEDRVEEYENLSLNLLNDTIDDMINIFGKDNIKSYLIYRLWETNYKALYNTEYVNESKWLIQKIRSI